jgi:3-hydroxyanthranilate 3,4-dioxygenase
MKEGFEWFCFNCEGLVHREEVALDGPEGIVTALPKIYDRFHNSIENRTCPSCGEVHPGKGKPPAEWVQL